MGVFSSFWGSKGEGGGVDHVPPWTLRMGRGEQKGSVFSFSTGREAFIASCLAVCVWVGGGGDNAGEG